MTFLDFVLYAGVGKLLIFFLQKFPFDKLPYIGKFWAEGKFLGKLFGCDLCLGFWVYTFLALVFGLQLVTTYRYIPILSELITGCIASFVMHTLSAGWNAEYKNIIVNSWSE